MQILLFLHFSSLLWLTYSPFANEYHSLFINAVIENTILIFLFSFLVVHEKKGKTYDLISIENFLWVWIKIQKKKFVEKNKNF
jgi:hypothetical protein